MCFLFKILSAEIPSVFGTEGSHCLGIPYLRYFMSNYCF